MWQATVAGQTRRITLDKAELSTAALDAVLGFMYTERLDINTEDVEAVLQVGFFLTHISNFFNF